MPWVKAGPVDWVSEDYPGYRIVQVGTGYEVHQEGRRIGACVGNWDTAIGPVEADMKVKAELTRADHPNPHLSRNSQARRVRCIR
jgi:hypothetical protein